VRKRLLKGKTNFRPILAESISRRFPKEKMNQSDQAFAEYRTSPDAFGTGLTEEQLPWKHLNGAIDVVAFRGK